MGRISPDIDPEHLGDSNIKEDAMQLQKLKQFNRKNLLNKTTS